MENGNDALSLSYDETLKLIRTGSTPALVNGILSSLDIATYDTITVSHTATTDVYALTLVTVAVNTYTVTYTDSTKEVIATIVKS